MLRTKSNCQEVYKSSNVMSSSTPQCFGIGATNLFLQYLKQHGQASKGNVLLLLLCNFILFPSQIFSVVAWSLVNVPIFGSKHCECGLRAALRLFCVSSMGTRSMNTTLLNRSYKRSHVTPIVLALHSLPVMYRTQFKALVITYGALCGQAPAYIRDPAASCGALGSSLLCTLKSSSGPIC